jgi:hypothetical protein
MQDFIKYLLSRTTANLTPQQRMRVLVEQKQMQVPATRWIEALFARALRH